jgi:beta-1,4-N-acetylglucosaminyltransferase
MIFVTVGTCEPFERLMRAVDAVSTGEPIIVQTGLSTTIPAHVTTVDFLPYDRLVERVREARIVVTHAGVGSILTALLNNVKPLVVPRLQQYGEAVDDHQLELARRLEELGLVRVLADIADLETVLRDDAGGAQRIGVSETLVHELRDFISTQAA